MKWTPEIIERVRRAAAAGESSKEVALSLGVAVGTLRFYASRNRISFSRPARPEKPLKPYQLPPRLIQPPACGDTEILQLRARWRAMIGAMKQQLRDDILRAEA